MKNKIFKISIILLLIMAMTMVNLVYVGKAFISYAVDDISTNVKNINFSVYFKDENGQKLKHLTPIYGQKEASLFLQIEVKQEGYFNGQIKLGNANFKLKEVISNNFVNKVEANTIVLNQINAGSTVEIEAKVELLREEIFDLNLLNMESEIQLKGIYKDSSEKDISVETSKVVQLSYPKANLEKDNIISNMEVITNKNMKINEEERKVVQIAIELGLKDNSYPIKNITIENIAPTVSDKSYPEVAQVVYMNMMTNWKSNTNSNGEKTLTHIEMTNLANDGMVIWKKQGNEEIVITYIAKSGAAIESQDIVANVKMTLYDGQEITAELKTNLESSKEINNTITTSITNTEKQMYKGKLYQGIDREYSTDTTVNVNLANAHEYLEIKEDNIFTSSSLDIEKGNTVNLMYKSTVFNKKQWTNILGEEGKIIVLNKNGETITTIDKNTQTDDNGNIIVSYGEGQEGIVLKTTTPVNTGKLKLNHNKVLKDNRNLDLKTLSYFDTIAYVTDHIVNERVVTERNIAEVELKEPSTEAELEIDKESLSTVISNNVEMKVVLKSNSESYDLYKNPTVNISLPEDVEKINLTKVEMLYEEEMKIKAYRVEGRNIIVELEGEQTSYKADTVDGANIVINAEISLNKKVATKDAQIQMNYTNQKATHEIQSIVKPIKIVAPTEVTAIYQIQGLEIDTMGQEEIRTKTLPLGKDVQELESYIEIINNKSGNIHDVVVLGILPTNSSENTMNISINEDIKVQGIENAKVYYTENEEATTDLTKIENGWTESITDNAKVKKYLITIDKMETQTRVIATYKTQIPANLEYNQNSKQWYETYYTDSETMTQNKVKSTVIEMTTGVGPRLETSITAKVGVENLQNGSKVKPGEVIKCIVEIANTGTIEMKDTKIVAPIPEGTTYVEAKPNYEYTGASYYQEVNKENYELIIDSIMPGEKIVKEYEVRVNKDIPEGTVIKNIANIISGEMIKQTNEIKCITETGDIRISVKRITDRRVDLYSDSSLKYYVIIENISAEDKNNVKVESFVPEQLNVERLTLITGLGSKDITSDDVVDADVQGRMENVESSNSEISTIEENAQIEVVEFKKQINIGELKAGESKVLYYNTLINKVEEQSEINFYAIAQSGQSSSRSNVRTDIINPYNVSIQISSNTENQYVKAGDVIEYNIHVKNETQAVIDGLQIIDEIPNQCTVQSVEKDGETINTTESNNLVIHITLAPEEEADLKICVIVDDSDARTEAEQITNSVIGQMNGETIATSNSIINIIEAHKEDVENPDDGNNDNPDNNIATGTKTISGIAWFDENSDGKKDSNEKILNNIKVKLLNLETNQIVKTIDGKQLEVMTNDSGMYLLNNISNGKYIVIFEYDDTQYGLTKYKVEETESIVSCAMINDLTIEGELKQVAATDVIELNNDNIGNVNIGLIKLQKFDLKLEKYVSRIVIQNQAGTTVKEYNNESLAKLELDAKQLNNTNAVIEYKIIVSNVGEIDGYTRKIVDYMPNDLKFNSELNKDWYQSGNNLYSSILANEKIKSGESKELTLTLIKSMTEDNVGRIGNTAEIVEDYNELGMQDINSTPNNRVNGENDMGSADAIISIRTGEIYFYSITIIVIIIALSTVIVPIIKTKNKKKSILDKV